MSRTARTGLNVSISKGERAILVFVQKATGQTRKGVIMALLRKEAIALGGDPSEIEKQKGNDNDPI